MNEKLVKSLYYQPEKKLEILQKVMEKDEWKESQREQEHLKLLQESMKWAVNNSEFYKKKYVGKENDFEIKTLEDMQKVPFLTREEMEQQYPLGMLSTDIRDVIRLNESGKTGIKSVTAIYSKDAWFESNVYAAARLSSIMSKEDLAIISTNYELSAYAQEIERACELIGLPLISCGIQNGNCSWARLAEIIRSAKATVLVISYTRALLIAHEIEAAGYDLKKDYSIKKVIVIGEMLTESRSKKLSQVYGAEVYGITALLETGTIANSYKDYRQYTIENRYHYEVVDTETLKNVPEGEKGELVITSLTNKAMPLIRYRTGVIASIEKSSTGNMHQFSKILHIYGEKTASVNYFELEAAILSVSDKIELYQIQYSKEAINVNIISKEKQIACAVEEKLENVLSKEWKGNVHVSVLSDSEGETYINNLKESISPEKIVFASK